MLETSGRLLTLLSLLQARRDWPGDALAERLSVSPRTVRRDVDRLRELGYPVRATKGPDGGYRLDAGTELPPLLFDDEQAIAVAVALQTATTTVAGIEEASLRALATVRQVMPARLRTRVDALQVTTVPRGPGRDVPVDTDVLIAVGSAVRAREVLRFDYGKPPAPGEAWPPPRRAEPHHLVTRGGRWYLIAWDLDRDDWRTFRVDRLTPKSPTGPRFKPRSLPTEDVATYVNERFGALAEARYGFEGTAVVEVEHAVVAPWVRGMGTAESIGEGRTRITASSWSWGGLAAWFGMIDAPLTIEGPDELRDAARLLAARYSAAADG